MKITPPPAPAEVREVAALEAAVILKENPDIRLLDVRTPQEREVACLENSVLLDQELVEEMLDTWDQDTAMMFICHTGERSRQAAQYFAAQGFQQVYNISDGIHGWSSSVDSAIPLYQSS
ncbi:MAG: rhodanese-like domain-containing protein [SAR324 cluster bacterium]|nr:rhodanese-like domain-containing protein [SAR324 cluster bacterium]